MQKLSLVRASALLVAVAVAACSGPSKTSGTQPTATPTAVPTRTTISVVTTFSTLNSFVEAVGGSHVTVQNLVPIGASPETYSPVPQDIATLSKAQLLVENGAGIEAWLQKTLANAANPNLVRVVCTDGLPVKLGNPHLWMDPDYAKQYVEKIRAALVQVDPADAADFNANARAYDAKLAALSSWIQSEIATIPPEQRVMIVYHNAWEYYDERFGIKMLGAIETSPGQEPNPQQLSNLVSMAKADDVTAIFGEPEYSPKLVHALAQAAGITVVDNLYDDSLGTDKDVSDYLSMMHYDTNVIVKALR